MADQKEQPKPETRKSAVKIHELYEVKGDTVERKNKSCPKCGKGTFLAKHKNRLTCGKCGYSEMQTSKDKEEPKKE
ncbi:30S ribosomal protein S27ae [Candidatus Woesearchaeota archaeon]|nr:30S ribosomal protein S27ae [Candidatus Woesearchaeota archaeon]